jgi:hypothetical protein
LLPIAELRTGYSSGEDADTILDGKCPTWNICALGRIGFTSSGSLCGALGLGWTVVSDSHLCCLDNDNEDNVLVVVVIVVIVVVVVVVVAVIPVVLNLAGHVSLVRVLGVAIVDDLSDDDNYDILNLLVTIRLLTCRMTYGIVVLVPESVPPDIVLCGLEFPLEPQLLSDNTRELNLSN